MKYCVKCGKELIDEAAFCDACGNPVAGAAAPVQPVQESAKTENAGMITAAIICAFLMPVVGLILGIVGSKKYTDPQLKNKAKGVIFLSAGIWIIYFFIIMVAAQL